MAVVLNEHTQYLDAGGKPLVGGRVYIGDVNSDPVANPKAIFSDRELSTALTNPQVLDANGRTTNKIWLSGRYSLEVRNSNDVQVFQDLDRGENESDIAGVALGNVLGGDTITAEGSPTQTSYTDKEMYTFTVAQVNTGPVTLNIDGIGARPVVKNFRQPLVGGDLVVGDNIAVVYNSTNSEFVMVRQIEDIDGQIFGLTLSNNAINPDEEINIAAGKAASENTTSPRMMVLGSFAKRVTGIFVEGNGTAGLDTATPVQADTWYHVFLIMRVDTNVTDILISSSVDNPVMPANYTLRRRIGSILTDATADILAFIQVGNEFTLGTQIDNGVTSDPGTTRQLVTTSTPLGVRVQAKLTFTWEDVSLGGTARRNALVTQTDQADTAPSDTNHTMQMRGAAGAIAGRNVTSYWRTDETAQVAYRIDLSDAGISMRVQTVGWIDPRGSLS